MPNGRTVSKNTRLKKAVFVFMKRVASPLTCFCGDAAGTGHCIRCRHPVCNECVIGAGGVVRQCPECPEHRDAFAEKEERPCPGCTYRRASTECEKCAAKYCSACVTRHGCHPRCRGCGGDYRLEECRGCNVTFCAKHLNAHVDRFCTQMAKCKNARCGAHLVIGTEGPLCCEDECYEVWCQACCPPVTAPSDRGVCWNHLADNHRCYACEMPTTRSFVTPIDGRFACCGHCMRQVRALYMSLRLRTPLLPELAKKITLLAIARGTVAWTSH